MELSDELKKKLQAMFEIDLERQIKVLLGGLLQMEDGGAGKFQPHVVDEMFRAAHNIKGTAGSIGNEPIQKVTTVLEDVIALVREMKINLSPEEVDLALEVVDFLPSISREASAQQLQQVELLLLRLQHCANELRQRSGRPVVEVSAAPARQGVNDAANGTGVAKEIDDSVYQRLAGLAEEVQVSHLGLQEINEQLKTHVREIAELKLLSRDMLQNASYETISPRLRQLNAQIMSRAEQAELSMQRLRVAGEKVSSRIESTTRLLREEVNSLRLTALDAVFASLPRLVRDLCRGLGKNVALKIEGAELEVDRNVLDKLSNVLIHLVRNAVDHGIETEAERARLGKSKQGQLVVAASCQGDRLCIRVSDNGRGIDRAALVQRAVQKGLLPADASLSDEKKDELIFLPGFSTTDVVTTVSGRGVGMDVVKTTLESMGGSVKYCTTPGQGTEFLLQMPVSIASEQGVIVRLGGHQFAFSTTVVARVLDIDFCEMSSVGGRRWLMLDNERLPVTSLSRLLELRSPVEEPEQLLLVARSGVRRAAFLLHDVVGSRELIAKALRPPIRSLRMVKGGAMCGTGEVVLLLNEAYLVGAAYTANTDEPRKLAAPREKKGQHILVVDDSIAVRTLEQSILEAHGYRVSLAVDGVDAWHVLATHPDIELVVTDLQMPNMDGFELTRRIRQSPVHVHLPILLVSTLTEAEAQTRGKEAGADGYIIKGDFETRTLLEYVQHFLGQG